MAWISVHQEIDGPKLRRLCKMLPASKAESVGILVFLWQWGLFNADESGALQEVERSDIADALTGITKIPSAHLIDCLFECGWLDEADGEIFIHDWATWQEQWYKYKRNKEYNTDRKRRERASKKDAPTEPIEDAPDAHREVVKKVDEKPEDKSDSPVKDAEGKAKMRTKKAPEEEKVHYTDLVSMTQKNHDTLVKMYGEEFTQACIDKLDYYKGSKGKTYKDDYRAILSWVVDEIKAKYPEILKRNKQTMNEPDSQENPFKEWRD